MIYLLLVYVTLERIARISIDINRYQWVLGEISCECVSLIIRRIVSG